LKSSRGPKQHKKARMATSPRTDNLGTKVKKKITKDRGGRGGKKDSLGPVGGRKEKKGWVRRGLRTNRADQQKKKRGTSKQKRLPLRRTGDKKK